MQVLVAEKKKVTPRYSIVGGNQNITMNVAVRREAGALSSSDLSEVFYAVEVVLAGVVDGMVCGA
jgi:hypothetical protein